MYAPLGNDHIVSICVDKPNRAVILLRVDCGGGVDGEVPDLNPTATAGGGHGGATNLGGERAFLPAFGVEIDLVSSSDQAATEVKHVSLGAASGGVDAREVQGQTHNSTLPERIRRFSTEKSLSFRYSHIARLELELFRAWTSSSTGPIPKTVMPGSLNFDCDCAPGTSPL